MLLLCEGWPEHHILDIAIKDRARARSYIATVAWHRLLCVKGSSEEVAEEIFRLCSTPVPLYRRRDWIPQPFLRRLHRDDRLAELLLQQIEKRPTPSERASVPGLLANARGPSDQLRSWSKHEIQRQDQLPDPEFGHDILVGEERAVSEAQLDVLASGQNASTLGFQI